MRKSICAAVLLLAPVAGVAQPPAGAREAFQKVCSGCHPIETVTSQRRTRAQWQENIMSMIARGAKGTEEEFSLVLDYLTVQFGPTSPGGRGAALRRSPLAAGDVAPHSRPDPPTSTSSTPPPPIAAARSMPPSASTATAPTPAAATRAPTSVRSEIVLHDRYGSTIGPFLKKGHPTQTTPAAQLTAAQIEDLSHTLHQEVYNTLRSALQIQNVLTGDPKAGAAYFNGAGKCATCHSPTGDLAHIGTRMDPPALQQRFLFPGGRGGGRGRGGRRRPSPVTVTVTPASGAADHRHAAAPRRFQRRAARFRRRVSLLQTHRRPEGGQERSRAGAPRTARSSTPTRTSTTSSPIWRP